MVNSVDHDQGKSLLLVDDDQSFLEQAEIFLRRENEFFDLDTSFSAKEALEKLESNDYDCIVSDYQMPRMNGLKFLEKVRKDKNNDIPFIIFTGKGREKVAIEALNLKADRYLNKGGNPKSQFQILARAIEKEIRHFKTEKEKNQTKKRLKKRNKAIESSKDGIAVLNENQKYSYMNQAHAEIYGYNTPNELLDESWKKLYDEDEIERLENEVLPKLQENGEWRGEAIGRKKDGTRFPQEISLTILENEEMVCIVRDISERKEIEKRKNLFFSSLKEASLEIFWINPNGRIIHSNKKVRSKLGYREEELNGMCVSDVESDENSKSREKIWNELKEQGSRSYETRHETKSGDTYPVEKTSQYIELDGEEYELTFAQDITKRKNLEREIKEAKDKYKSLFENSPVVIWEEDFSEVKKYLDQLNKEVDNLKEYLDQNKDEVKKCLEMIEVLDVNEYALEFYGAESKEELISRMPELSTEEAIETIKNQLVTMANDGTYFKAENTTKTLRDEVIHIIFEFNVPEKYSDDYSRGYVTGTDISERKEAEKKLRTYIETSPFAIFVSDNQGKFLDVNEAACKITNYSEEELLNMNIQDLLDLSNDDKGKLLEEHIDSKEKNKVQVELPFIKKDGSQGFGDIHGIKLEEDRYLGFVNEITRRKKAEEKVKKRLEFEKTISSISSRFVNNDDIDNAINNALSDLGNLEEASRTYIFQLGKNGEKISETHEWSAEGVKPQRENRQSISCDKFSWLMKKLHKQENIQVNDISELPEEASHLKETLKARNINSLYLTPMFSKGQFFGFIGMNNVDEKERRGSDPIKILKTSSEVIGNAIERKQAEEREEFLHSLLRHDLRNKISVIEGYLQVLEDLDLPDNIEQYVNKLKKTTSEGNELINKIRVLRKAQEETKDVKITSLIQSQIMEWRSQAKEKDMEIELNNPKRDYKIKGGKLISRIFSNIIENAIQHSKGNKIKITGQENNKEVKYIIEDDGAGIPDEKKKKIFNKGYTTDEKRGSGLGLFLIKKLLNNYDGRIEVEDSKMGGAKFKVYLKKSKSI